ncbi:MAG TPA: ABC transporter family substrate-binding protein [Mycolicibacterium fallax]|nr:ABC transporter family substrate-binding protein [Mycolicibacterium fallax]HSA39057.1 ABC transporter family substrate-binding protein [Mycobacterium sp.]
MWFRRGLYAVVIGSLVLSGCSGGPSTPESAGGPAEVGATSDTNPHPVSDLRPGGNLRLAITGFPSNFNSLHIDGNDADTHRMLKPTMPRAFRLAADGSPSVDTDYFTSVELTGTDPQVVTYTINPKAVWSDGSPITWEDIRSQIEATSGKNKEFAIANTNGSERVASVTRGVDDRQAIITFAKHYTEWRGMFAGNGELLPRTVTADPTTFNTALLNGPGLSAGPFIVSDIDRTAQRVTLTRNPLWWGTPPVLESMTFLVLDDAARIPALQNNTIDAVGLSDLDEMTIARSTPGLAMRRAPAPQWYHLTFNGAPGSILADRDLRRAIAKGIDRNLIATVTQRGLTDDPLPLNNHVFVRGQQGYRDNSQIAAFDPEAAKAELDELGWLLNGQYREKDGRQLVLRDVLYDGQIPKNIGQIVQNSLAQIGVKLELLPKPGTGFFSKYVIPGNFDVAQFSWVGDAFPFAGLNQIFAADGESNFGKIGSPEIDAKIEQTLDELDSDKARELANELDTLIWAEGFSLPLTQTPGNMAVRSNLANYGPAGLGDLDFTTIGFLK